ncbi:hypothetical protein Aph01nite_16780 [Acrocarpospora phusangensis]|uniref:Uncharacterized protein n=1 Tax=Acrocarpospora phusangensis TaxID=1070424 RepID=A0A919Q9L1_9ACTN|nr:hypothetical protein Aph01nite_16780 [Acrocarpospora phusangensis]
MLASGPAGLAELAELAELTTAAAGGGSFTSTVVNSRQGWNRYIATATPAAATIQVTGWRSTDFTVVPSRSSSLATRLW